MRSERCLLNWTVHFITHAFKIERKGTLLFTDFLNERIKRKCTYPLSGQLPSTRSRDFEAFGDRVSCTPLNNFFIGTNDQTSDADITDLYDIATNVEPDNT